LTAAITLGAPIRTAIGAIGTAPLRRIPLPSPQTARERLAPLASGGLSAWAALLAVQYRVVEVSPNTIACNSSATFFGIALSGPLGGLAISTAGAHNLTLVAAGVVPVAA